MPSRLLLFLLSLLTITIILITPSYALEDVDYDINARKLPFTLTSSTSLPGTATTPFSYSYNLQLPATTTGYGYLPPSDPTKVTMAIIPQTALTDNLFNVPVAPPSITAINTDLTLNALSGPSQLTEGYIYTNAGTTKEPLATMASYVLTFPSRYLIKGSQSFFVNVYGCISTPSRPLTSCPTTQVRIVYSSLITMYPSDYAGSVAQPADIQSLAKDDLVQCYMGSGTTSSLSSYIGDKVIPTGIPVYCSLSIVIPPFDSVVINNVARIKVDVVATRENSSGSTHSTDSSDLTDSSDSTRLTDSAFSYGYPTQTPIFTRYSPFEVVSYTGSTETVEFLADLTNDVFVGFDPNMLYTIRLSLSTGPNYQFMSFASILTPQTPQTPDRTNLILGEFRIISDCDLYDSCLTYTPRRPECLVDGYLTKHRSLSDFSCHCNQLFGGLFCQNAWHARYCAEIIDEVAAYDCYVRTSTSHLIDNSWSVLSSTSSCFLITPPTEECVPDDRTIGCDQVEPAREIDSTVLPSEYNRFTLGSEIKCSPRLPFPSPYQSLYYEINVIWDPSQTEPMANRDITVFTNTVSASEIASLRSTISFSLTDPSWFTPPAPALVTNPNLTALDARFYVVLRPALAKISSFHSPIFSLRTACDYYDTVCPSTLNFDQCSSLASSPFVPLIKLTRESCFCRSGYYLQEGVCEQFRLQQACTDGIVTRDGCCKTFPLISDIKQHCASLTDGITEITALQISNKNDHNTANSADVTLTGGDEISIEWATVGNLTTPDGNPITASLWLFMTESQVNLEFYPIDITGAPSQDDVLNVLNAFSNEKNNYVQSIRSQGHASGSSGSSATRALYPLFLTNVQISKGSYHMTLPSVPLSYNSILVMAFKTFDYESNKTKWVYRIATQQRFHLYPTCLSVDLETMADPMDTDLVPELALALVGRDRCGSGGECNHFTGQCQCPSNYNKYIISPPTPNLCQLDVCAGYLVCMNGSCDPTSFSCKCDKGWKGEFCEVEDTCNPNYDSIRSQPLDQFVFGPTYDANATKSTPEPTEPDHCSRYGFHEVNWMSDACHTNCKCLDGYLNAPYCDTCDITCHHKTKANLHQGCNSCQCTRYNEGPYCTCHRLPMMISVVYPVIDDGGVDVDNNPVITDDNTVDNINNEFRTALLSTIELYYQSLSKNNNDSTKTSLNTGVTPQFVSADGFINYKITTAHVITYILAIIKQETGLDDTSDLTANSVSHLHINSITVRTSTNLTGLTEDGILVTQVPSNIQLQSMTIDAYLLDNCTLSMADSNFNLIITKIHSFIQTIRQGNSPNQHIWGQYREFTQYMWEYIIKPKTQNVKSIPLTKIPTRSTITNTLSDLGDDAKFVTILPNSVNHLISAEHVTNKGLGEKFLKEQQRLLDDVKFKTAPRLMFKSNTPITMVQFDPIYYLCAEGNTVPDYNRGGDGHFGYDLVQNMQGRITWDITPDQVQFNMNMDCFDSHAIGNGLVGVLIIVGIAVMGLM